MAKAQVSLVKLRESGRTEELGYLEEAVERAVGLVGGWGRYVKPGDLVFIKANQFIGNTLESGFMTHQVLLIAVAKALRAAGAARVVIGELNANVKNNFKNYPQIHDYAELLDLGEAAHTHAWVPGNETLRFTLAMPDIVKECDVFINMPGLRSHALPLMSNAMKNLMGLLPLGGTGSVHVYGLAGSICDLNYQRPSDLIITDAIYSVEENFPAEGRPVKTDLIMAADNVVAADVVAAHLMKFCPYVTVFTKYIYQTAKIAAHYRQTQTLCSKQPERG